MIAIVAGGRHFRPTKKHILWLVDVLKTHDVTEICDGGASGADRFGRLVGEKLKITVTPFHALWDEIDGKPAKYIKTNKFGKKYYSMAGFERNMEMAKYADLCILFSGGNGTADMKSKAKR